MKQSKQRRALVGALAMAGLAGKAFAASPKATADRPVAASDRQYTQWGWPLPYKRVSDTSIAWLKEKGWWPLALGWQAPWSGQNAVMAVMNHQGLLNKRGIEENSLLLRLARRLMSNSWQQNSKWAPAAISQ